MSRRAFFIAGDRVVHIANPCGAGMSYQAVQHRVLPGEQAGPRAQERADTVLLVEAGTIEVMVNGLSSVAVAGDFVRIPAKAWFAYRNDSDRPALVLCRTSPVRPVSERCSITVHMSAA